MIKLQKKEKPSFLTEQVKISLVAKFKLDGSRVWDDDRIKEPLRLSSHNKCAYCECSISEESKYMEVEHFEHKGKYPDGVVDWDNLLPSCKRCNIAKGVHDTRHEPIVNPFKIDPKNHLTFSLYRLKGLDAIGKSTIDVLDLNNSDRLVLKRFQIGEQIHKCIESAMERYESYLDNPTTKRRNKLVSLVEVLLLECQSSSIYSATASTILFGDANFVRLVSDMKSNGLWVDHIDDLACKAYGFAL